MTRLVIVESPAKSKKIQSFLPEGFLVDSCVGHVRDLPAKKSETPEAIKDKPWADYGVDIENGFKPYYVTIHGKGKVLQELRRKLNKSDELLLATDEDREGEAISWHLVDELKPKVPVRRMVFNEITKSAIREALENTRELDMHLVHAQETRRILDRLYGYALSPLLWKKVGGNLSAGRVQSVAVRLVVDRERDRRAFVSGTYWDLRATLEMQDRFEARLASLAGTRVATGDDFDRDTGRIKEGADVVLLDEPQARDLQARLENAQWTVGEIQQDVRQKSPEPPFTTSTLQQEANNRLDMSARDTMRTAQRLYENGFITYMRTDSTELSDEAVAGARAAIEELFGRSALSETPRKYQKKSKNAQEAHEAIRPAGEAFQHPDKAGLAGRELDLYRLIWARTLASQMHNERFRITTVLIDAEEARFVAKGRTTLDPGFRLVYPHAGRTMEELPAMKEGDHPGFVDIAAEGHETQPPARFTEASLVRALEQEGIGRPSTYASIMDTIIGRGYVTKKGKALVPSFTAFAVVGLLEKNFPRLIDLQFTAKMEDELDAIAAGEADWVEFLQRFFSGPDGLQAQVDRKMQEMDPQEARIVPIEGLPCAVKIGRFGPYIEADLGAGTVTASIPESVTPDELDEDMVQRLIREKAEGPQSIGTHPDSGQPIYLLTGRFGPYLQLGEAEKGEKPPRSSLPRGVSPEDLDLDLAVFLLSLPRPLGTHPEGGRVIAGLGRYGPFVAHEKKEGTEYRSLKDFEHLRHVDLDDALTLLAQPKGRSARGQTVLRELGEHPKDGKPVQLLSGRYGPYVKHGKTNASLPKGRDAEAMTLQDAVQLLSEKASKPKATKRR